jgi:hypothetical protein
MTNPSTAAPTVRFASPALIALAWLWATVPFAYGIWELLSKVTQLFGA